jgi:hypothetical protein
MVGSVFLECSVCIVHVCGVALLIFYFYRSRIYSHNSIIIKKINLNNMKHVLMLNINIKQR